MLCRLLLPTVPEEVKWKVIEDVEETPQLAVVSILDEVWNFVAPCGQEEIEGLTKSGTGEPRKMCGQEAC